MVPFLWAKRPTPEVLYGRSLGNSLKSALTEVCLKGSTTSTVVKLISSVFPPLPLTFWRPRGITIVLREWGVAGAFLPPPPPSASKRQARFRALTCNSPHQSPGPAMGAGLAALAAGPGKEGGSNEELGQRIQKGGRQANTALGLLAKYQGHSPTQPGAGWRTSGPPLGRGGGGQADCELPVWGGTLPGKLLSGNR